MKNLGQEFSVDPSNGEVKSASYREKKKKKKKLVKRKILQNVSLYDVVQVAYYSRYMLGDFDLLNRFLL